MGFIYALKSLRLEIKISTFSNETYNLLSLSKANGIPIALNVTEEFSLFN